MDSSDFSRYVDTYRAAVYRLAYCRTKNSADADDITQNVFLKLYTHSGGFKENMSSEEVKAWLLRTAVNECNDLARSFYRTHSVTLADDTAAAYKDPADYDGENAVMSAVMKLKPDVRTAMYMHYYEDYTAKEIAAALGRSETWVTTNLARGRKKLKDILVRGGFFERSELCDELQ